MTESQSKPVRIGAIGMDQRQRNTLRMLFSSKCNNRYHLVEETSAELFILDLDGYNGTNLWREFRQRHQEHPLILVSLKDQPITDPKTLFVRKPIPVQTLIDAIEQQCRQLASEPHSAEPELADSPAPTAGGQAAPIRAAQPSETSLQQKRKARKAASILDTSAERAFVGTAPDIDVDDPQQLSKIYYNPDHYLLGHLQQALNLAVRYNRNVAIEGPWPPLELMIDERRVLVAAEERRLRSHCTLSDATLEVTLRTFDGKGKLDGGSHAYPMAALFWKVALWASRGRIPEGTSLSQPIYLRRWPNFTRLDVTPYALAITALWAEQPRSLIDTASHLQIPQRYVFAFYSAAKSLQLAGETRRAVDTLLAPPELMASRQRGLFGRLVDRLRGEKLQ
jgi:hypothetical protein